MTYQFQHGHKTRSLSGSSASEFGPALFILFVIVLLPMLSLITFIAGVATVYFATNYAAREAGTSTTRFLARQNMYAARDQIINGPFGKFCNMVADGGDDDKGMELRTVRVGILAGSEDKPFAGTFPQNQVNSSNHFFQYKVVSTYKVKPLFYPGEIPVQFNSTIAVEHREGINTTTP